MAPIRRRRPRPFPRPGPPPPSPPPVLPPGVRRTREPEYGAIGGTPESARDQIGALGGTSGHGSPEGVVVGSPGDTYVNLDGGANLTFWVKESGVDTNTGWVAK